MRVFEQQPKATKQTTSKTAIPNRARSGKNHNLAGRMVRGPESRLKQACACGGRCPKCRANSSINTGRTQRDFTLAPAPSAVSDAPPVYGHNFTQTPVFANTAPEAPTMSPNGIETETTGEGWSPAPAPGVFPPSPPPPPATPRSDCSVTGSFSNIPSGVLAATMTGSKLGTTFDMVGDFTRAPVTHYIGPGVTLHPTSFRLDGNATTANYFGRRDYRTGYSHFEPDQAGGASFRATTFPESPQVQGH